MKKQSLVKKSKLGESVATSGSGNRVRAEARAGSRAVAARRSFLKTAAATALAASLPLTSLPFDPFRTLAFAIGSVDGGDPAFRAAQTFDDAHAASCRVRVDGASGSGTFVGVAGGLAWILTNYHVVGRAKTTRLDFWTNSVLETVDAAVKWRAYDASRGYDFAFCTLDPAELARIAPPFVRLGGTTEEFRCNCLVHHVSKP